MVLAEFRNLLQRETLFFDEVHQWIVICYERILLIMDWVNHEIYCNVKIPIARFYL